MTASIVKNLKPPADAITNAPSACDDWDKETQAAATKMMSDAWKNEETRFNNLNSRSIAVVSAASLVTTLIGYLSKNLLDPKDARLDDGLREFAVAGTGIALLLILAAISFIVFGVLRPGGRAVWGNNAITDGTQMTVKELDKINYVELGEVYKLLVNRNIRKAYWLTLGYHLFSAAILVAALTGFFVMADYEPL